MVIDRPRQLSPIAAPPEEIQLRGLAQPPRQWNRLLLAGGVCSLASMLESMISKQRHLG